MKLFYLGGMAVLPVMAQGLTILKSSTWAIYSSVSVSRGFLQTGKSYCFQHCHHYHSKHSFRIFSTQSPTQHQEANPEAVAPRKFTGSVTVLDQGPNYLVVAKPPSVLCHHSGWAGSRSSSKQQLKEEPEIPMLQRVRQAIGQRVNVVHRLDRGCSGCLLFARADTTTSHEDNLNDGKGDNNFMENDLKNATAILSDAMAKESTTKTYIAIVRGEGILHERDLKQEGWFEVSRPIKNERGILHNATTFFRFLAGQDSITDPDRPRASLVLARPVTGKWHQIRRHLNGLSHPILGDSSHGNSKVNREWRELRGMPFERTCLHLAKLEMAPTPACPDGMVVSCPLPSDMMDMLSTHLPGVLHDAAPLLREENIELELADDNHHPLVLPYEVTLS